MTATYVLDRNVISLRILHHLQADCYLLHLSIPFIVLLFPYTNWQYIVCISCLWSIVLPQHIQAGVEGGFVKQHYAYHTREISFALLNSIYVLYFNSELYSVCTECHMVAFVPVTILVVSLTPNVFMIDQYIYFWNHCNLRVE